MSLSRRIQVKPSISAYAYTQTGSKVEEMSSAASGWPACRGAGRQTGLSGSLSEVDITALIEYCPQKGDLEPAHTLRRPFPYPEASTWSRR